MEKIQTSNPTPVPANKPLDGKNLSEKHSTFAALASKIKSVLSNLLPTQQSKIIIKVIDPTKPPIRSKPSEATLPSGIYNMFDWNDEDSLSNEKPSSIEGYNNRKLESTGDDAIVKTKDDINLKLESAVDDSEKIGEYDQKALLRKEIQEDKE